MNNHSVLEEPALAADFAHRVVDRVRRARRRRRLIREIAGVAASAAVLGAIAYLPARDVRPSAAGASSADGDVQSGTAAPWVAEVGGRAGSATIGVSDPLGFFFPGATVVAEFQSWQAASWHSYDPWWNPNQAAD